MAIRTFSPEELFEVNGKFVEKEFAFPDLEGDQTAIMLRFVNGKWEFSLWGSAVDAEGTVACGWEPMFRGNRPGITVQADKIMADIEKGE